MEQFHVHNAVERPNKKTWLETIRQGAKRNIRSLILATVGWAAVSVAGLHESEIQWDTSEKGREVLAFTIGEKEPMHVRVVPLEEFHPNFTSTPLEVHDYDVNHFFQCNTEDQSSWPAVKNIQQWNSQMEKEFQDPQLYAAAGVAQPARNNLTPDEVIRMITASILRTFQYTLNDEEYALFEKLLDPQAMALSLKSEQSKFRAIVDRTTLADTLPPEDLGQDPWIVCRQAARLVCAKFAWVKNHPVYGKNCTNTFVDSVSGKSPYSSRASLIRHAWVLVKHMSSKTTGVVAAVEATPSRTREKNMHRIEQLRAASRSMHPGESVSWGFLQTPQFHELITSFVVLGERGEISEKDFRELYRSAMDHAERAIHTSSRSGVSGPNQDPFELMREQMRIERFQTNVAHEFIGNVSSMGAIQWLLEEDFAVRMERFQRLMEIIDARDLAVQETFPAISEFIQGLFLPPDYFADFPPDGATVLRKGQQKRIEKFIHTIETLPKEFRDRHSDSIPVWLGLIESIKNKELHE